MDTCCIALKQRDQALIEKVRKETSFEMALRVKRVLGLDQALLICDFSREELESEKLNSKQKFKEIFE